MAKVNYVRIQTNILKAIGNVSGIEVSFAAGIYFANIIPVTALDDASAEANYDKVISTMIDTQIGEFNENITINTDLATRVAKAHWLWRTKVAYGGSIEIPPNGFANCDYDECFTQTWRYFNKQDLKIATSNMPGINKVYNVIMAEFMTANINE